MSARQTVVVTDQVFPDVDLERRILGDAGLDLVVADGTREGALALAGDAIAMLNTYLPIDAGFIEGAPQCRIVARYGIGTDNIDIAAAQRADMVVTNVPDYCVEEVATHALTLVLALVRRLPESMRQLDEGAWGVDGIRPVSRVSELTVGLLGYGRIARRLAESVRLLGATVVAHDPYVTSVDDGTALVGFEELLRGSDVLSVHAPLTPDTRGVIDADALRLLPPHAVVVNTSRGPLIVLADLLAALREGRLRGAGLDVFEVEPPDPEQLRDVPGLIATPHTAFYSESSLKESQRKAATQIVKVLRGEALDYQVLP
ncbi:MAG: C-terminal binding protein [Streptosporangiales bacterium]|nr:C-terminal binding protein [Streptosporangiales bacterium]